MLTFINNLKAAAQSYSEAGTLETLEQKLAIKTKASKSAKQNLLKVEHRIKNLAEIIKYAERNYSAPPLGVH